MRFVLVATVSTANPKAISAVLEKLVGHLGSFKEVSTEDADRKGKSEFLSYKQNSKDRAPKI